MALIQCLLCLDSAALTLAINCHLRWYRDDETLCLCVFLVTNSTIQVYLCVKHVLDIQF